MDDLQQRRLDRLNQEYKNSPQYVAPVFTGRQLFWMTVFLGICAAMVSFALLD